MNPNPPILRVIDQRTGRLRVQTTNRNEVDWFMALCKNPHRMTILSGWRAWDNFRRANHRPEYFPRTTVIV